MKFSVIYRNIFLYRIMMNFLYAGKYIHRYTDVIQCFPTNTNSITELCFGDTYIAKHCRKNKISWIGIDINPYFVKRAKKLKYDSISGDINTISELKQSDIVIMIGSLYHFNSNLSHLFNLVKKASPIFIISEPIVNLSSRNDLIGFFARKMAKAGKGNEEFRFNEHTINQALIKLQNEIGFSFEIISKKRDILIKISYERN